MTPENTAIGRFMTAEAAQSMGVFAQAATLDVSRFRAAPGSHLGCYTFKSQGAFPA